MESSSLFLVEEIDACNVSEQDPSPDSDEGPSKKRARKLVTKTERDRLVRFINGIHIHELAPYCLDKTNSILATHRDLSVREFGLSLEPTDIQFIVIFLRKIFSETYQASGKGKEKFMTFQYKWHQKCSILLVKTVTDLSRMDIDPQDEGILIRQQWVSLYVAKSITCDVAKTFMIVLTSEVYNEILRRCHVMLQPPALDAKAVTPDPIDVYYRFGGATLANMLHTRYKAIKTCPVTRKEQLGKEIGILQMLNTKDKSQVPKFLQYRDKGYMYFPCNELFPFLQLVDVKVKSCANEENFKMHGKNLVQVTTANIEDDADIKEAFHTVLQKRMEGFDQDLNDITGIMREFIRKLCNTQLQEFIDSFKTVLAAQKGSAAISGQNLRDTLLSQHVHLKTKQS